MLFLGGFDVGEFGELVDDADGFDAYGADALEEVDDVFLVVGEAVGVEAFADGRVSGFALFVLVEDPFEGGSAAETVLSRRIRGCRIARWCWMVVWMSDVWEEIRRIWSSSVLCNGR